MRFPTCPTGALEYKPPNVLVSHPFDWGEHFSRTSTMSREDYRLALNGKVHVYYHNNIRHEQRRSARSHVNARTNSQASEPQPVGPLFIPRAPQRKLGDELRANKDGDDETFSTKDTLRDVMRETFPELEARQLHALESLADQREDGRWGFANIEKWGFRTLQEVQDQHILLKSIKPPRGG